MGEIKRRGRERIYESEWKGTKRGEGRKEGEMKGTKEKGE